MVTKQNVAVAAAPGLLVEFGCVVVAVKAGQTNNNKKTIITCHHIGKYHIHMEHIKHIHTDRHSHLHGILDIEQLLDMR